MPAHNEEQDVGSVVEDLLRRYDYPVVVVDDASTDATMAKARAAGAIVIPLASQLGAWGAIQTGMRYAAAKGFDFAITMDADGQHKAASIEQLVKPIIRNEADVSIGTCTRRGSLLRQIAWVIIKRFSGLSLEDITSGFRVFNHKAVEILAGKSATLLDYQDVGVLMLLQSRGIRIADVGVSMSPRRSGISRIFHSWPSVAYYISYTLLLSITKRGYKR
jgi:glycosyltransferase involved in cell wall biosynthesis